MIEFENDGVLGYIDVECKKSPIGAGYSSVCKPKDFSDKEEIANVVEETLVENGALYPSTTCKFYVPNLEIKQREAYNQCIITSDFVAKIYPIGDPIANGSFLGRGDNYESGKCDILHSRVTMDDKSLSALKKYCIS